MDNYDRIVAFMNGKDPSEVQTTKARNIKTSVLSFIAFVGAFILIALISMYLANKFFINHRGMASYYLYYPK